jgi:uncharacterized protein (TIGR03792 family)
MATVELLRFRVEPSRADDFVARNERLWTPALRARDGFLRRELLRSARGDEIVILVYWRDRAALEAFPRQLLESLEGQMADLVLGQEQWVFEQLLPGGGAGASP